MKHIVSIAMLASTCLLIRCGQQDPKADTVPPNNAAQTAAQQDDHAQQVMVIERDAASKQLRKLRDDIEERLTDVDDRLKRTDLNAQTRKAVEDERTSLLDLRQRIDHSLEDMDRADTSTWEEIKTGVKKTADDVGDWFKKMGEKVDKETKADVDKDGH